VVVVALQKECLFRTQIGNFKPDLVIVFVVCLAMQAQRWLATVAGFLLGLLQGAWLPAGATAVILSRGAVGYGAARLAALIAADNVLMSIPFVFLGTWVGELVHYAIQPWIGFPRWAGIVAAEAIVNSAAAPVLYLLVAWLGVQSPK